MRNEATIACVISARADSCANSHNKTLSCGLQQREKVVAGHPRRSCRPHLFDHNPSKSKEKGVRGLWFRISCGMGSRGSGPSPPNLPGHRGRRLHPPMRAGLKTTLPQSLESVHAPPFASWCLQNFETFWIWQLQLPRKPPDSLMSKRSSVHANCANLSRSLLLPFEHHCCHCSKSHVRAFQELWWRPHQIGSPPELCLREQVDPSEQGKETGVEQLRGETSRLRTLVSLWRRDQAPCWA